MATHTLRSPDLHASAQHPCRRAWGRQSRLSVHARLKIPQNHKKPVNPYVDIDADKLHTDANYLPAPTFGPVKLTNIPGQGRGLILTAPCGKGSLLLVSAPAGRVARAAEGLSLQPEHLLPVLMAPGVLSEHDRRRIRLLYNGQPSSLRLFDLSQITSQTDTAQGATGKDSKKKPDKSKGFGKAPKAATPEPATTATQIAVDDSPLTEDELRSVLRYNAWSEEYADRGLMALRQQEPRSYVGLWPEFALVNHSCVPNSLPVLFGDRLLLRAARANMPENTQVTVSYLGFEGGSPASERQRILQANHNFTCSCPRCKLEQSQPSSVTCLIEDMYSLLAEGLADTVRKQINTQDWGACRDILSKLEAQVGRLEALMEQEQVPAGTRDWLRASAYGTYELMAILRLELGLNHDQDSAGGLQGADTEPLADETQPASLIPLVEVFQPGSESHVYLCLESLTYAGQKYKDRNDERVKQPTLALLSAHATRYGRTNDAVNTKLVMARTQTDHYMGRVSLTSSTTDAPAPAAAES